MKRAGWRLALFIVGLLVIYITGVVARGYYGIRVLVDNRSEQILRHVSLKVESAGVRYDLGDLAVGVRKHIFIAARTESHVNLEFLDGSGKLHTELVVGYAEAGYCGSAKAIVQPYGRVFATENIDAVFCKGSWLDFLR